MEDYLEPKQLAANRTTRVTIGIELWGLDINMPNSKTTQMRLAAITASTPSGGGSNDSN